MIVRLSTRALRELEAIRAWIARDNPVQADTYIDKLLDACAGLGDFPRRYKRVRFGRRMLHQKTQGNYLIFFAIRRDAVDVVSIRHGARDPSTLG